MQFITLYKISNNKNFDEIVFYKTFLENNEVYIERENEFDKFKVLCKLDDVSPTFISEKSLCPLIDDLILVLKEAQENNDKRMFLHIIEIIFMCKFCLWNEREFFLKFAPWGVDDCPENIPEEIRYSISDILKVIS